MFAAPAAWKKKPSLPDEALVFANVLFVTFIVIEPAVLEMVTLLSAEPLTVEELIALVPVRLLISMPLSPTALPLFVTDVLASVRPPTVAPPMPSSPLPCTRIHDRLTGPQLSRRTPVPVTALIVPPDDALPVTLPARPP